MGEKVKGLRSTNWQLQNSHEDVKSSLQNIVNNIVITTDGVRSIRLIIREIVSRVIYNHMPTHYAVHLKLI